MRARSPRTAIRRSLGAFASVVVLGAMTASAVPSAQAAESPAPTVGFESVDYLAWNGTAIPRSIVPLSGGDRLPFVQDRVWLDEETLGTRTTVGFPGGDRRVDLTLPDPTESGAARHAVFVGAEALPGDRVLFARDASVARLLGNCLPTSCPLTLVVQRADGTTERTGTLTLGDADEEVAFRRDLTSMSATAEGAPRICETRKDGTVLVHGFTTDLVRDTDFGTGGSTTTALTQCMGIASAPDGSTYLMGNARGSDGLTKTRVTRLLADGDVDTAFGNAGVVTIGDEGIVTKGVQFAIEASIDGSVYVGQVVRLASDRPWKGAVSHVLPDGVLDSGFGTAGTRVMDADSARTTYVDAILPTPDGLVVTTTRRITETPERRCWNGTAYVTCYGTPTTRDHLLLIRLTATGAWDQSFVQPEELDTQTRGPVLAQDQQGRILLATGGPLCERGTSTTFCKRSSRPPLLYRLVP